MQHAKEWESDEPEGGGRGRDRTDQERMRRFAWEIGTRRAYEHYAPEGHQATLAPISPSSALATWHVHRAWEDEMRQRRGNAWHGARLVLRLYDVSNILFNGFNAHHLRDVALQGLVGERIIHAPLGGTHQLAEVGFLLHNREFVPAARSAAVQFPPNGASRHQDSAALYVDARLAPEPVTSPWDAEAFLRERRKPKLRTGLRIAFMTFESELSGHGSIVARFVSQLAAELSMAGQAVEVLVPQTETLRDERQVAGVRYRPLTVADASDPVDRALAYARAAEARLRTLPPFDLVHAQEWMTALLPGLDARPTVLALTSIEATRRTHGEPTQLSQRIETLEVQVCRTAPCLLVPAWLRDTAASALGLDRARVRAFPMEGRPLDEWTTPLDYGKVKAEIGFGPFDRVLLFVGPLEHGAAPDLIIEALPVILSRTPNARVAFIGTGAMHDHLWRRAHQLGVAHAVRLLGHLDGASVVRLMRASEALILPSRHRVANDEAVVALARRAARPVLTTHAGPGHLVAHERTGVVTYDNPGSVVWGTSRLLDDPVHTERMGQNGKQAADDGVPGWSLVARHYADLCAEVFPALAQGPR